MKLSEAEKRVVSKISEGEAIALTQELVRIPSIFPNERECALLLAQRFRDFGIAVDLQEVEPGRPNVIGEIAGFSNGPTLLIEGHTDVVGLGDERKWTVDPWGAEIREGRLYGRGSQDMKSGLAAAVIAAKAIVAAGIRLNGTLRIAGFVDEENNMIGVKHYIATGGLEGLNAAITVEPTFALGLGTCFAGRTRADVVFRGRPTHVGFHPRSGIGRNAIHMAWRLLRAIEAGPPPHQTHAIYKDTHWQVVSIGGGHPAEATVPGSCTVRIDARQVPGHGTGEVWEHLKRLIASFKAEDPTIDADVSILEDYGTTAWETSPDEQIVQSARRAYQKVLGVSPPINAAPEFPPGSGYPLKVSTDLHQVAPFGVPCLNTGPLGSNAHAEDEYVMVEDIGKIARVLAVTALDYLGIHSG